MKKLWKAAIALSVAIAMTACDKDKDNDGGLDEPDIPETPGDVSGSMEQLSPSETKKFIQETLENFLGTFRAADQRDFMSVCAYVIDEYGDLDAPNEFVIDAQEEVFTPADLMKQLLNAYQTRDANWAGVALIRYTYTLDFDKFKGVYEPGTTRWIRKDDSDNIVFRFKDEKGQTCLLTAAMGGGNSDITITDTDQDWSYDYDGMVDEEYVYNGRIPKSVQISLTCGGNTLVDSKVNSDISIEGHTIYINSQSKVANLGTVYVLNGNDTEAKIEEMLTVNGETVSNSSLTIHGSHLCDLNYFRNPNNDDDTLMEIFQSGASSFSIMGKLRIDGTIKFDRDVYRALQNDFRSETEAERYVKCLNENVTAKLRFNNTETVQAYLFFDVLNDHPYYDYQTLLKFDSDGTTYSFGEYFTRRSFRNVCDQWYDLCESYRKVWEALSK